MYQLKELLKDLGVEYTPELLTELSLKYDVNSKSNIDPVQEIIDFVCNMNGLTYVQLVNKTRRSAIVQARRELMWLMNQLGYKKVTIAYALKCDHTTVLHHLNDLEDKFMIRPREKAILIDKYKLIISHPKYLESIQEMECKYVYKYPRSTYVRKDNLERI